MALIDRTVQEVKEFKIELINNNMDKIEDMKNRIIEGDLFKVMGKMPNNSVDMVFIDPPYNLKKNYSVYKDNLSDDGYIAWCNRWLSECIRVLKTTGSLFVINIPKWLVYHSQHLNKIAIFKHWISWDALGFPTNSKLLPAHYGILWYTKTDSSKFNSVRIPHKRDMKDELLADWGGKKDLLHPYGKIASDIWNDIHRIRHKVRRNAHPCQLPPHLIERMILMTTEEGDLVLDPMVGTGTTSVATKRMGRKYIGIDIDPQYIKIANENVKFTNPTKIGGAFVSVYLKKALTIRDKDYKKVEPYLITKELKINGHKTKTMRLPKLDKRKLKDLFEQEFSSEFL